MKENKLIILKGNKFILKFKENNYRQFNENN